MTDSTETSAKVSEVAPMREVCNGYTDASPSCSSVGRRVLWDTDGRRYLDFLSGFAVNGVGHCHPKVVEAVQRQCAKLMHVSNLYLIEQQAELAQALCKMTGMEKAFLANSGAEANEAALKIARKLGNAASPDKTWIVAAANSFHGRTLGTLAITGQEKCPEAVHTARSNVTLIPYNDTAALRAAVDTRPAPSFWSRSRAKAECSRQRQSSCRPLAEAADGHRALLIFDEIQTGCGRTGGIPCLSGVWRRARYRNACQDHGWRVPDCGVPGTWKGCGGVYAGRPRRHVREDKLACAAALAAVRAIESEACAPAPEDGPCGARWA